MAKVKVYVKAQNRLVLGIVNAYMIINPKTTFEDLRKAFPSELNPDKGVKENFIYADQQGTTANWDVFFKRIMRLSQWGMTPGFQDREGLA